METGGNVGGHVRKVTNNKTVSLATSPYLLKLMIWWVYFRRNTSSTTYFIKYFT